MDVNETVFYSQQISVGASVPQRAPAVAGRSVDSDLVGFLIRACLAVGLLGYLIIR